MVSTVTESISEALEEIDPNRSFAQIKRILVTTLRDMNPQIQVTSTSYFNHTHVPDMVVRWPNDDDLTDRYIYLRTATEANDLKSDIAFLARENRPIVLALGNFEESTGTRALNSISVDQNALVLDLAALSVLTSASTADSSLTRLVSKSVIEGGQGVLDERTAARLTDTVTTGARAARRGERLATDEALAVASTTLSPPIARRLTAFLTTLWQGSGAPVGALERAPRYQQKLDESSLEYLLQGEEILDEEFWHRITRSLTLYDLLRMRRVPPADNLQHLMRAALISWDARACSITSHFTAAAPRGVAPWRWSVNSGILTFHAPSFILSVAQKVSQLTSVGEQREYELPPVEWVRERVQLLGLSLKAVTLLNGGRKLSYQGKEGRLHHEQLNKLSQTLGLGATVKDIEAWPPSGMPLRYNFSAHTSSVKSPRGSVPLLELVNTSVHLFTHLSSEEEELLMDVIPPGSFDLRNRRDLLTRPEAEPPDTPGHR
ncbi:hypothetical protein ACWGKQ_13645 [Streptomyces sp. NPDC054770]